MSIPALYVRRPTQEQRLEQRVRFWLLVAVLIYSLLVAAMPRVLDEPSIRLALRLQARLSFGLFVVALAAPGWHRLLPSRTSAVLTRGRSSLLLAFGVAHLIHGLWILLFFAFTPHAFSWNLPDTSGLVAFVLILLLVCAELPAGQRRLGIAVKFVEGSVLGYVWIQFAGFFIMQSQKGRPELFVWYLLALGLNVAAAVLAWLGARPNGGAFATGTASSASSARP
jgi:hypothetical protein